jgi:hypothetical protein
MENAFKFKKFRNYRVSTVAYSPYSKLTVASLGVRNQERSAISPPLERAVVNVWLGFKAQILNHLDQPWHLAHGV